MSYLHKCHMHRHHFLGPPPLGSWGGLNYLVNFLGDLGVPWGGWGSKIFSSKIQPDLVCELLTCMVHARAQFFGSPPPWALGRGQKFNFLNMVMWHIKFKGMSSRPGYTDKF